MGICLGQKEGVTTCSSKLVDRIPTFPPLTTPLTCGPGLDSREAATVHTGQKQKLCKETPTTGDDDELVSD